ncbi:MAG: ATP-binding protein [Alphaproteobacteria bacterium]|nr:ATP-binding protein [Alphaproteobacteria bacterium]
MATEAIRSTRIRAASVEVPKLLARIEAEGRDAALPEQLVAELCLCLDELLNNVIDHAGLGDETTIELNYRLGSDGVAAEIVDPGPPFDPLARPPVDIDAPLDARVPGGLGIHFVRTLMDEVAYERRGSHNRLRIAKRRGAGGSPAISSPTTS